jgi:hypothetical protein
MKVPLQRLAAGSAVSSARAAVIAAGSHRTGCTRCSPGSHQKAEREMEGEFRSHTENSTAQKEKHGISTVVCMLWHHAALPQNGSKIARPKPKKRATGRFLLWAAIMWRSFPTTWQNHVAEPRSSGGGRLVLTDRFQKPGVRIGEVEERCHHHIFVLLRKSTLCVGRREVRGEKTTTTHSAELCVAHWKYPTAELEGAETDETMLSWVISPCGRGIDNSVLVRPTEA